MRSRSVEGLKIESQFPQIELEPLPRHAILMTGGGGATGQVVAERFAREGYPLIIGTRSEAKFITLGQRLASSGLSTKLQPFIADIARPDEVSHALDALNLKPGKPLHFFSLAAEGIKDIRISLARAILPALRAARNGQLTASEVDEATERVKAIVQTEEAMRPGLATNFEGPRQLAEILVERGHLRPDSTILTLSSSISHDTDSDIANYRGPWLYLPIGYSKELGVRALCDIATRENIGMVDVVAPEIEGTDVAKFFDGLVPIFQAMQPDVPFVIPSVKKGQVANTIYRELTNNNPMLPKQRTVFVGDDGNPTYTRPESWGSSLLPYL